MRKITLFIILTLLTTGLSQLQAQDSAQVRFNHYIEDGRIVDLWIDGEVVLEAFEFTDRGDYLPLVGTVSVAIAETGSGIDDAFIGPIDIDLSAGHNYTLSTIGLLEEDNTQLVLIDETEALEDHEPSATQTTMIIINGMSGIDAVDYMFNGDVVVEGLPFGEFEAFSLPSGPGKFDMYVSGDPDRVMMDSSGFTDPYGFWVLILGGYYSGPDGGDNYGMRTYEEMSANMVEFLPALSDLEIESIGTYNTLSNAIEVAGLNETLSGEGSFVLLAPNDAAFEALPDGMLDDLLADPDALADVVLYHVLDFTPDYDDGETALTTLQGSDLIMTINDDGAWFNDAQFLGLGSNSSNGQILYIDGVLLPSEDD